jgi:DNA-binding NtrC family response regulator
VTTILFVDDDPGVLRSLERALHRDASRWTMVFACGSEHALTALRRMSFDAVVTDIRMPGTDGARLLTFIRERHPTTRRLVLSGDVGPAAAERLKGVAHALLAKPCPIHDLRRAIEAALAQVAA